MSTGVSIMERRRRQRVPVPIAIFVTSLKPDETIKERGIPIDVSSNGAQLRMGRFLPADIRLRIDTLNNRVAGACVISCDPDGQQQWRGRVQLLQQTGNFWGLKCPPKDWEDQDSLDMQEWHR
jgi:hypothetical protein